MKARIVLNTNDFPKAVSTLWLEMCDRRHPPVFFVSGAVDKIGCARGGGCPACAARESEEDWKDED